ncbi:MAG: deoxyguanosinetriphosphate triphosphohydrolase family protein [bacterium]
MDILIVKVKKGFGIGDNLEKSLLKENKQYIYNTKNQTEKEYIKICNSLENDEDALKIIFIIHEENNPEKLFYGISFEIEANSNIFCELNSKIENETPIKVFLENIEVDLKNDFKNGVYILKRNIPDFTFLELIKDSTYKVDRKPPEEQSDLYDKIDKNDNLNNLAQRNDYCIRPICSQKISNVRSEFQRDRERIVHAKGYRRLVDKAQIFNSSKGDHFRTRMTHTLEVAQIARDIAERLNLNLDLTEAIAMAHDIGHTPFGHQGERTLDKILRGDIKIIPEAKKLEIGGFKHNFQALRLLTNLEEKYFQHEGLDISYQTLEGVLKHTKGKIKKCRTNKKNEKENECIECNHDCFDIEEFLTNCDKDYLYTDKKFATTLEGQVVNIADEIAQRGHDLDDAFASKNVNLEQFKDLCEISNMESISKKIKKVEAELNNYKKEGREIIDELDMIRAELVPEILGYFINDAVETSARKMKKYLENKHEYFNNHNHRVDEKLILFSGDVQFQIEYLEKIISRYVINSYEISRLDNKAELIIKGLFDAYYTNPKLLPDNVLKRIKKEMYRVTTNFIDLRENPLKFVSKEIKELVEITEEQKKDKDKEKDYKTKRKVLARCIADYISGMTDNFAINEYSNLYQF